MGSFASSNGICHNIIHLILCKACYRISIVSAFSGDEQKQFEYATCGAYFFEKGEKKLRFQKHPDASVQGLTRKHVGLFAKHATINALTPLTLTFLRTLVSSNEETASIQRFFHSCFPYSRYHYLVYLFAGLCKGDFNPSKSSKATTIQCY